MWCKRLPENGGPPVVIGHRGKSKLSERWYLFSFFCQLLQHGKHLVHVLNKLFVGSFTLISLVNVKTHNVHPFIPRIAFEVIFLGIKTVCIVRIQEVMNIFYIT